MCGIVGYVGKSKEALKVLIESLETLEYRGYDSAGIAFVNNSKVAIIKEKGKIINLKNKINFSVKTNIGIGHTRWATHGESNLLNSHPHRVGKITIVHNGIIENYIDLKEKLKNENYNFKSSTDTEVACAMIDYLYKKTNDMLKSLVEFKKIVNGSYALGILCDDNLNCLYSIRKDSPLILASGNNANFIASDVPTILKYTNKYLVLDSDEIAIIDEGNISIYNDDLDLISKQFNTFESKLELTNKNGYDHYMIKEINEQSAIVKNISDEYKTIEDLISKFPSLKKYNNIDIVGCGSAYHAGCIAKNVIEKYVDIFVNVEIASEYRYKKQFHNNKTLVIFVSQSGETADTLACLRKVKQNNIDTLGLVNVAESSIARLADNVIYLKAGPEIAVATTKAYLTQVLLLSLIALNMAYINNKITKKDANKILADLILIPSNINNLINRDYKTIAKKICKKENIFFLGRGIDYALSLEGSLKLKEISYIHSEAYPAGELKHGTISLIDKNVVVIAIITDELLLEKTISNIKEVKSRGAKVILIIKENLDVDKSCYDLKVLISATNYFFEPLLTVIPLQLVSYEVAKLRGCDIDKPKNLAKSVTVE